MKKIRKCVIALCIMALFAIDKVNAECDNKTRLEINTASSNVTMNYNMTTVVVDGNYNEHPEISIEEVKGEDGEYGLHDKVVIQISNLTDKIYFTFINEDEGIVETYHYSDLKNGTFTYEVPDTQKIRNYTVKIYSDVNDCLNDELRTLNLTTPMYNQISSWQLCENSNEYYCQEYITSPITLSEDEIVSRSDSNGNGNNNGGIEEEKEKNKIWIYVGIAAVAILIGAIVYLIFKRKNDDLDLGGR